MIVFQQPFDFTLGQGMVIKGWDNGLKGMCAGERRRLTIPSDLGKGEPSICIESPFLESGYGDSGSGAKIPGGATLVIFVGVFG